MHTHTRPPIRYGGIHRRPSHKRPASIDARRWHQGQAAGKRDLGPGHVFLMQSECLSGDTCTLDPLLLFNVSGCIMPGRRNSRTSPGCLWPCRVACHVTWALLPWSGGLSPGARAFASFTGTRHLSPGAGISSHHHKDVTRISHVTRCVCFLRARCHPWARHTCHHRWELSRGVTW